MVVNRPNIIVCFSVETMGEHRDNKHVDDEADEESDGGLDEVVHVGLAHLPLVCGVDAPGLDEGAVEIQVVRHDDGSYHSYSLEYSNLSSDMPRISC